MLFNRFNRYKDIIPPLDKKKLIALSKKLLPDTIFNMASLEGNPFTYPEVQTLIDGITVGGHKVSDEQQIYDLRDSWNYLYELISSNKFELTKEVFNKINFIVAKNEALVSGEFRSSQVRIGGTLYMPPKAEDLEKIFMEELSQIIDRCESKRELAIEVFLWGALNQFYYDGNKRTGRLVANGVLLSNGQGILNIKARDKLEFNKLMIEFYETKKADNMCDFLINNCIDE